MCVCRHSIYTSTSGFQHYHSSIITVQKIIIVERGNNHIPYNSCSKTSRNVSANDQNEITDEEKLKLDEKMKKGSDLPATSSKRARHDDNEEELPPT